jgi:hypothetical protein
MLIPEKERIDALPEIVRVSPGFENRPSNTIQLVERGQELAYGL